jgi:transposase-like protein
MHRIPKFGSGGIIIFMGLRENVQIECHWGVMMDAEINCPKCGSARLERYGKTSAGLQKYRCLLPDCRRQFVAGSEHLIDADIKNIVLQLLAQQVPPTRIKRAVAGISLRWIYELKRRTGMPTAPGKNRFR